MCVNGRNRRRARASVRQAVILACVSSLSLFAQSPKSIIELHPFKLCLKVIPNVTLYAGHTIERKAIESVLRELALPTLGKIFPGVEFVDQNSCLASGANPRLVENVRPKPGKPPIPALRAELHLRIDTLRRIKTQLTGTLNVELKIENPTGDSLYLKRIFNDTSQVSFLEMAPNEELRTSLLTALSESSTPANRKEFYQRFFAAAGEHMAKFCIQAPMCLEFEEMYPVLRGSKAEITPNAPFHGATGRFDLVCNPRKFVFIPMGEVKSAQIVSITLLTVEDEAKSCR